jgi:hypothetical protein
MAAGGKRIVSDRVEWITIADPATAAAALQNDEVDWLELPLPDLVPTLRQNRMSRWIFRTLWATSALCSSTIYLRPLTMCGRAGRSSWRSISRLHARVCRRRQDVDDGGGAPSTAGPQHADAGLAAVCGERAKAGCLTKPAPKIRLTRRIARRY